MTQIASQIPVDMFAALHAMRETVFRVWQRFVAQMSIADLQAEDCWLLLQLAGGPLQQAELEAVLTFFVEQPQALIKKALSRGWICKQSAGVEPTFELTAAAREFFRELLPIANAANHTWRDNLIDGPQSRDELDFVLATLQGTHPSTAKTV